MCRAFLQTGSCNDANCKFAHSEQNLRTTKGFFKTKLCRFSLQGRCKNGPSCRFAHSADEINKLNGGPFGEDKQELQLRQTGMAAGTSRKQERQSTDGSGGSTRDTQSSWSRDTTTETAFQENVSWEESPRPLKRADLFDCNTLMLTNVPEFMTQGALVSLFEDLTVSMRGAFDFVYCPWDTKEGRNLATRS
jgi:hypothetical protein